MEKVWSPKRRFEIVLHCTKPQKTPITDTAVKVSPKTVFFELSSLVLPEFSKQITLHKAQFKTGTNCRKHIPG
jgi:hypothetical protein